MHRYIIQNLIEWLGNPRRMPLLLRGPRQVGKSYIVAQFGQTYFKQVITINFELSPHLKACFNDLDPVKIVSQLEMVLGVHITDDGKTLLFLDEIQECPQAILALRYFKEKKPELPVIAAGSLLEFALAQADFRMPVGRVQYLYLRPFSFEEYLTARGFSQMVDFLRQVSLSEGISEAVHGQLSMLLREYMIIGGMPAAVQEFQLTQRFQAAQSLQESLLATYRDDFGKYAKNAQQHLYLRTLFERAPGLVGESFKFSKIDPDLRVRELKPALEALVMAGLVHRIYHTAASGVPLSTTKHEAQYKLHFIDVGLMVKAAHLSPEMLLHDDFFCLNRGALMEQFVGQELLAYTPNDQAGELYYWGRKQEKVSSQAEVDYVVAIGPHIVPVEVKAGKTGRLKSLQVFMEEKNAPLGVKVSMQPLALEKNILSVPTYMLQSLPRLILQQLRTNR